MRHPWRGLPLLLAVSPGVASAGPHGPTAAIGAVFAPAETTAVGTGEKVQEGPLMGPMVQVGYQTGDWVNHQFMAQFSMSSGSVSYDNAILDSNARLRTAGIGYELTLNIFGKAGKAGFTPILGAGVLVGWCQADVSSHSDDAKVEAALENAGVADEQKTKR